MDVFSKFVILTAVLLIGIGFGIGAGAEIHLLSENNLDIFSGNHLLSDNVVASGNTSSKTVRDLGYLDLAAFGICGWVMVTILSGKRKSD